MKDDKERRNVLYILTGGVCDICHKPLGTDYQRHHSQHDTVGNNDKYPLYTQSLIGFKAEHRNCHEKNPSFGAITDEQAARWEAFLRAWVNVVKGGAPIPFHLVVKELTILKKENL
jgi:hypothetical protein